MAITIGSTTIRAVPTAAARAKRAFIVLLVIVGVAYFAPQAVAGGGAELVPSDTWTVASGETLWSISVMFTEPGGDVRSTLEQIKTLNAFESTSIRAGQQILVPSI